MQLIICIKNESNLTNRYWDIVRDRKSVDGRTHGRRQSYIPPNSSGDDTIYKTRLRGSPDLLYNVKKGQGQLQFIIKQISFNHIWGLQPFWCSDLNNLMNNPPYNPVISEKKMFR